MGSNTYKIRLAIASKNRGKSGGARVITYFVNQDNEVFLLSIYDKSERADIPDSVLQELIQEVLASK
nr:type II toxin-antitoxin system RelE/ParE family toxin [uncultured Arsenicibacter sp.]